MKLVVDACVFAAAQLSEQTTSPDSTAFLDACIKGETTLYAPAILLPEVAATVARAKGSAALGEVAPMKVLQGYRIVIRNVDEAFALLAARLAARFSLRGADSLYVALVRELRASLITDDGEMLVRGAAAVDCMTPAVWLRRRSARSSP
jgi:predicted nucleic acid-binding protein